MAELDLSGEDLGIVPAQVDIVEEPEVTLTGEDLGIGQTVDVGVDDTTFEFSGQDLGISGAPVDEPEPEVDTVSAIGKGLQRAVAPTTLSKEELLETSIPEVGGQVVGEIGSSVAAGATGAKIGGVLGGLVGGPAGAAIGANIGAVGGPALWGLYKGIASEASMSEAQDREFDPARAAVSVGVELNPLSKGGKLARGARQAALQAGEVAGQGGDLGTAAFAGALGGGLVGLSPAQKNWIANTSVPRAYPTTDNPTGKLGAAEIQQQMEFIADDSGRILEKAQKIIDSSDLDMKPGTRQMLKTGRPSSPEDSEFARWFIMKDGAKIDTPEITAKDLKGEDGKHFTKLVESMSDEELQDAYRTFKEGKIQTNVAKQYAKEQGQALTGLDDPLENSWFGKNLRDPLFVGRDADNLIGTNAEGGVAAFSHANNNFSTASAPFLEEANKLVKQGRKDGVDSKLIGRVLAGQEAPEGAAIELAGKWRELFNKVRDHQISKGQKIGHLDNYFPQTSKSPGEFIATMQLKMEELAKKYPGQELSEVPEAEDFLKALKHLKDPTAGAGKQAMHIKNSEIPQLIKNLRKPQVYKNFLGFEGSAGFKRHGEMPNFIREFDVGKAFQGYVNTNLKPIYFRKAFQDMSNTVNMIRGAGLKDTADYFDDYLRSMSGQPSNFNAMMDATATRLKANAILDHAHAKGMLGRGAAKTKEFLPDFIAWNTSLIYPNNLGYSLKAPIRNMTQTWMLTAPEVGGAYGYDTTRKAWGNAIKSIPGLERVKSSTDMIGEKQIKRGLGLDKMEQFLQSKGLAAGKFFGEGANIISDSLRGVKGLGKGIEIVDDLGQLGMTLYSGSDIANRYITYHVGKQIADDFAKGVPNAKKFIDSMSSGGKAMLRKAKNKEEFEEAVAKYLVSKTQFNYGREGLSKFGRDYGRVVSMFTKWPVMIGSDINELVRQQKIGRIMAKYIAPLSVLMSTQAALDETGAIDNPAGRLAFGKGITSASSLSALTGLSTPPLVQGVMDLSKTAGHLVEGDWKKAGKQIKNTLGPFMPGGFIPVAYDRIDKAVKGK